MAIGRGDATSMIDNILQNIHPDWGNIKAQKKSTLRAKFHDEKRYGKRWSILVAGVGPSILFLCSQQLAKVVYALLATDSSLVDGTNKPRRDTTITLKALETIIWNYRGNDASFKLLQILNPFIEILLHDRDYSAYDTNQILEQVRAL
jgi:hypothetical protein